MFWSLEHMRPTRMPTKSLLTVALFFGLLWPICTQSAPQKAYFLGNSFTWDSQPNNISTATTFPNGIEQEIGWGIYSGKSLTFIVDEEEDGKGIKNHMKSVREEAAVAYDYKPDLPHTGDFVIDLPGEAWDVISMQPHTYGGGLFLESEIAAAKTVIDTARLNNANACTTFFIYGPWAFQEGPDKNEDRTYSENWLSAYNQSNLNDGKLPNVRQAFRGLYWDQVKAENPEATVNWIPVGEVLYRIDQELQKGVISGISGAWDLFDEFGVHLADTDSNGIAGRYISHITTLSTIWASEPSSFTTKYEGEIDTDFKALVDTIAWSTIQEFLPTYACDNLVGQTLDFPPLPDIELSNAPPSLQAEASSGLDIVYEVLDGPATIVDEQLEITTYGTITIRASQLGNDIYKPASSTDRTFKVYSPFNWWRFQALGSDEETGDSASLEDPDKDSLSNIIEYFLGTSPTEYTDQLFFEHLEENKAFYVQTRQAADSLDGIDVFAEVSTDLNLWTQTEDDWVEIVETESGDLLYKLKAGMLPPQTFIRLRIEAP